MQFIQVQSNYISKFTLAVLLLKKYHPLKKQSFIEETKTQQLKIPQQKLTGGMSMTLKGGPRRTGGLNAGGSPI